MMQVRHSLKHVHKHIGKLLLVYMCRYMLYICFLYLHSILNLRFVNRLVPEC